MRELLRRIYQGGTEIDFIGKRKTWFALSGVVIIICLLALPLRPAESSCAPPLPAYFKGLNCGIEFKGGIAIQAPIDPQSELAELSDLAVIERLRDILEPVGAADAQIQVAEGEGGRSVLVQTSAVGGAQEQEQVARVVREAAGATVEESPTQRIGRKWGGEITTKAIRALLIFLVVVFLFISWRFDWKMAVAALTALTHDLIVTAGVYSIVGFEVTPSTVIAILTILGYSLYDTVVVFDKVEEDAQAYAATGKMTYQDAANLAMNQVFARSLNTSLITLIPVATLLFIGAGLLGASTLQDLALALLIGLITSAYSSIFIATPVLTMLKEHEPRYQNVRKKVLLEAKRAAAKPATATSGDGSDGTPATRPAATASRPSPRAGVGTKKARRRKRR